MVGGTGECKFCGKPVNWRCYAKDAGEMTQRVVICENTRCQARLAWEHRPFEAKVRQVRDINVGSFYIRGGKLPTMATHPHRELMGTNDGRGYYLCGPTGTGKTWTLCALACDALAEGFTVRMLDWQMFALEIRNTYGRKANESELDVFNRYLNVDVLCVDELGVGKLVEGMASEASRLTMRNLMNQRYYNNKRTHISSNVQPSGLEGVYGDATERRILSMCSVVVLKDKLPDSPISSNSDEMWADRAPLAKDSLAAKEKFRDEKNAAEQQYYDDLREKFG